MQETTQQKLNALRAEFLAADDPLQVLQNLSPADRALATDLLNNLLGKNTDDEMRQRTPSAAMPQLIPDIGSQVGPFKLEEKLGEGGSCKVYLAGRIQDPSLKVALKLLKNLNAQFLRRFSLERQILSKLQHPHISRIIDANVSENGLPWIAMEYISGIPIDAYCNQKKLHVTGRLQLFLQVCEAVTYAHRNMIIHRDLKPGNILVDAHGIPKLLDFGIAAALNADTGIQDMATRFQDLMMTPHYASPEQLKGEPLNGATDVYSLGVLLYEVLTGSVPHPERATSNALTLALDVTRGHIPPMHSAITMSSGRSRERLERIAQDRDSSLKRLRKVLSGDLQNIVEKALQGDREHRYATVEHFAQDIRNYLAGKPVSASSPTITHRIKKYVRRHRAGVAMVSTVFLLLVGFSITMWHQVGITRHERDLAQKERDETLHVTRFLEEMFADADPTQSASGQVTIQQILDQARSKLNDERDLMPHTRARLLYSLAKTNMNLGYYDIALELCSQALNNLEDETNQLLYWEVLETRSSIQMVLSNFSEAREDIKKILAWHKLVLYPALHANALDQYAELGKGENDVKQIALLETALQLRIDHYGEKHDGVATSLNNLGMQYKAAGDFAKAETYYLRALEVRRAALGPKHLKVAIFLNNLAQLYISQGKPERAETYLQEALQLRLQHLHEKHPSVANIYNSLGMATKNLKDYDKAAHYYQQAMDIWKESLGPNHPNIGFVYANLSGMARTHKNFDLAEEYARRAYQVLKSSYGAEHPKTGMLISKLAQIYMEKGQFEDALSLFDKANEIFSTTLSPNHFEVTTLIYYKAQIYAEQGDWTRASELCQRLIETLEGIPLSGRLPRTHLLLGRIYLSQDKFENAAVELRKAKTHYATLGGFKGRSAWVDAFLADTLLNMGNTDEAQALLENAWSHFEQQPEEDTTTLVVRVIQAHLQEKMGDKAGALAVYTSCKEAMEAQPYPPVWELRDLNKKLSR